MKLDIKFDIGEVEIETHIGHGSIEGVYINGVDYADMSVAEMVMKVIGETKWQELISKAASDE